MAHNVMEPRQTVPVLENVLLEAQGDTLCGVLTLFALYLL
jgi:DNA polymerase III sliding clamp (beta) subunit (PCNA family)